MVLTPEEIKARLRRYAAINDDMGRVVEGQPATMRAAADLLDSLLKPHVYQVEGTLALSVEDRGMAVIAEFEENRLLDSDPQMFVRLQSWDDKKEHPLINSLKGHRVRVTVEIVE